MKDFKLFKKKEKEPEIEVIEKIDPFHSVKYDKEKNKYFVLRGQDIPFVIWRNLGNVNIDEIFYQPTIEEAKAAYFEYIDARTLLGEINELNGEPEVQYGLLEQEGGKFKYFSESIDNLKEFYKTIANESQRKKTYINQIRNTYKNQMKNNENENEDTTTWDSKKTLLVGDSIKLKNGLQGIVEDYDDKYFYVRDTNANTVKVLKDGVWALPFTKEEAQKLYDLVCTNKYDGEDKMKILYGLFGSDSLFDDLYDSRLKTTVFKPSVVKMYLRRELKLYEEEPDLYRVKMEPEAKPILERIVNE